MVHISPPESYNAIKSADYGQGRRETRWQRQQVAEHRNKMLDMTAKPSVARWSRCAVWRTEILSPHWATRRRNETTRLGVFWPDFATHDVVVRP
jgi:hypothetical protein